MPYRVIQANREARFWSKVQRGLDCWLWTGAKIKQNGYGRFMFQGDTLAHRVSYRFAFGSIPDGMEIGHHCDNRACVRPSHLYACTHKQNMEDGKGRGRIGKLSWEQADAIRSSTESIRDLSRQYGVHHSVVHQIKKGRKWQPLAGRH